MSTPVRLGYSWTPHEREVGNRHGIVTAAGVEQLLLPRLEAVRTLVCLERAQDLVQRAVRAGGIHDATQVVALLELATQRTAAGYLAVEAEWIQDAGQLARLQDANAALEAREQELVAELAELRGLPQYG